MDSDNVTQGILVTIFVIPFLTVLNIILAATGCFFAFYIVKGLVRLFGQAGDKIKTKTKKLGVEIKEEASRLRAQS